MLRRLGVLLAGGWIASCALAGHHPQKLPDGSYQASCTAPLTSCLRDVRDALRVARLRRDRRQREPHPQRPSRDTGCDRSTARPTCGARQPEPPFSAAPSTPRSPDRRRRSPRRTSAAKGQVVIASAQCRELGPLSNPAPASSGPGPGADVAASNRGARASVPRASAVTGAGLFDSWPAGSSPQEVGARVARNYLARPLALGSPMHYAEACTWYGALTTAKLTGDAALETRPDRAVRADSHPGRRGGHPAARARGRSGLRDRAAGDRHARS